LAIYPLSASKGCSLDGKLTVELPVKQLGVTNSFAPKANVAVAYSQTTDLAFKNIGGLLAIIINSDGGHTIKSIRLAGTAAMSGEVDITQASIAAGNPSVDALVNATDYLTLDLSDGVTEVTKSTCMASSPSYEGDSESFVIDEGDWGKEPFYLVSLPGSHTGFVLTLVDSEGKTAVAKSTYAFTITRNSNTVIANIKAPSDPGKWKSDPQVYINEVDCKNKKIELYNPNNEAVDLSGWLLTKDEHSWAFPLGSTIPAKGYCIVNCKQSDCSTGPMFGLSGDKGFDLKLSNGGLVDRIDNLSKITVIGSTETFGRKTDGAAEWVVFSKGTIYNGTTCDGDNSKGTIKGDEPVVPTSVVLNEIDGNVKFIELYNKGSEAVSLEGWTLYKDEEQVWLGTASHSIAAGSYFTIYSSKSSSIPAGAPTFSGGISPKKSVRVDIKNADGKTTDTFTRGSSPWGTDLSSCSDSFGRTPNGSGTWQLTASTPGAANGASKGDIPQN